MHVDRTGQTLLGKYRLTRRLGKGGMGEVWEGEHAVTGRRVAIKVLSEKYLANAKVVKRFGREARAASAVHHPGIVEILDHDRTPEGVPFLVMEFLEGESLGDRLRARGKLPEREALAVMLPLLDALEAAHSAGVIHRDLKPDNVYLLPDGRGHEKVKILDFGISQKADEIDHKLTQEGSVLGTPHYMSPEQARGELGIDARADLYAAGVVLYELVVGDVPFDAGNYNALLVTILSDEPVLPRTRGAQISAALEEVLMGVLAKDREARPPDAAALRAALSRVRDAQDVLAAPPSSRPEAPALSLEPGAEAPRDPFSSAPPLSDDGSARGDLAPLDLGAADDEASLELAVPDDPFASAPPASRPAAASPASAPVQPPEPSPAPRPEGVLRAMDPRFTRDGPANDAPRHGVPARTPAPSARAPSRPDLAGLLPVRRSTGPAGAMLRGAVRWVIASVVLGALVFFLRALFERDSPQRRPSSGDATAPR